MERVVATLLAFLIETPALTAVVPNGRDLRIFAQVSCVVHNKECSYSSIVDDSFNMLFLIKN